MAVASSWDMLTFSHLTQKKIAEVGGLIIKKKGKSLSAFPEIRQRQMITAREVHNRFEQGKFHHEPREVGQMMDLCEWLAAQHAEIKNHPDPGNMGFDVDAMIAGPGTTPEGRNAYDKAYALLQSVLSS